MKICDTVFISVDIETTGLNNVSRIVEIGSVKFYPFGQTIEYFDELIHPGIEIPENVIAIHGITNEMVEKCPDIEFAISKWIDFISDVPLFAHNSHFDFSFLNRDIKDLGFSKIINPIFDTLKLSRLAFPKIKHNLNALCNYFGIQIPASRHRGLTDAILAAQIFERCVDRLNISTVEELQKISPAIENL